MIKTRKGFISAALGLVALTGCVSTQQSLAPIETSNFTLDPTHAFLTAQVMHFGISAYSIDLTEFDAQLDFDSETPENSKISVQIDPMGLDTQYPDDEKKADWEAELSTSGRYLDGEDFPSITFVSTSAERSGEFMGAVTGDLNLRGITKPVTLDVTYNGTASSPLDGGKRRVGFTATGTFNRSDFGMDALTQFVSDEVTITFSGEFLSAE
ncbi:MAG: YceI family protein [Pseudomonadota bacterium]